MTSLYNKCLTVVLYAAIVGNLALALSTLEKQKPYVEQLAQAMPAAALHQIPDVKKVSYSQHKLESKKGI